MDEKLKMNRCHLMIRRLVSGLLRDIAVFSIVIIISFTTFTSLMTGITTIDVQPSSFVWVISMKFVTKSSFFQRWSLGMGIR